MPPQLTACNITNLKTMDAASAAVAAAVNVVSLLLLPQSKLHASIHATTAHSSRNNCCIPNGLAWQERDYLPGLAKYIRDHKGQV